MSRDLRPASSRFTARSFYLRFFSFFLSPSRVLRPYVPRGETIRYRGVASAMVAVTAATVAGCASKEKMPPIEVLRSLPRERVTGLRETRRDKRKGSMGDRGEARRVAYTRRHEQGTGTCTVGRALPSRPTDWPASQPAISHPVIDRM